MNADDFEKIIFFRTFQVASCSLLAARSTNLPEIFPDAMFLVQSSRIDHKGKGYVSFLFWFFK
jgi:hypothetical protein